MVTLGGSAWVLIGMMEYWSGGIMGERHSIIPWAGKKFQSPDFHLPRQDVKLSKRLWFFHPDQSKLGGGVILAEPHLGCFIHGLLQRNELIEFTVDHHFAESQFLLIG